MKFVTVTVDGSNRVVDVTAGRLLELFLQPEICDVADLVADAGFGSAISAAAGIDARARAVEKRLCSSYRAGETTFGGVEPLNRTALWPTESLIDMLPDFQALPISRISASSSLTVLPETKSSTAGKAACMPFVKGSKPGVDLCGFAQIIR